VKERFGALFIRNNMSYLHMHRKSSASTPSRYRAAISAAGFHFLCSVGVALIAAILVYGLWYPPPYHEMSGGQALFLLVLSVDVVCGPLLTLVLFNPVKPRAELWRDLALVALIQLGALGYGLWTVWQARPLYLVQEVDRYKVIMAPDLDAAALARLPQSLQPKLWAGPQTVAIREPKDFDERNKVLFESVQGGRDFSERPEFYIPYQGEAALKSLKRAKPLAVFLIRYPGQQAPAQKLAIKKEADMGDWLYLPVIARQDWIAIINKQGQIQGFLPGDGF
jgi:hypothetical protein